MQYVAIRLFGDGAMKRHKHTQEPETTALGDFDSLAMPLIKLASYLTVTTFATEF